jgi:hypothetical protein
MRGGPLPSDLVGHLASYVILPPFPLPPASLKPPAKKRRKTKKKDSDDEDEDYGP